jgi:Hydrazine synthase alpha subunit middle domain/F5/8 type C domain
VNTRSGYWPIFLVLATLLCGPLPCSLAVANDQPFSPDRPNAIRFEPVECRYVRIVIHETARGPAPAIDALEIFAEDGQTDLAASELGALATASSVLKGHRSYQIPHLNNGLYGSQNCWIADTNDAQPWVQIRLARPSKVARVTFSRDRTGMDADRVGADVEVLVSTDGNDFRSVARVKRPVDHQTHRAPSFAAQFRVPIPAAPIWPPKADSASKQPSHQNDLTAATKDELGMANLSLNDTATARASSALPGYEIHQIKNLNDGLLGNSHSWISNGEPSWAEIDLGREYWIYRLALGSDSSGRHGDRVPEDFEILTATEYQADSKAKTWKKVGPARLNQLPTRRTEFKFKPVRARYVRVTIQKTNSNSAARIDELEVYGREKEITLAEIGPIGTFAPEPTQLTKPAIAKKVDRTEAEKELRLAIVGEEHAWLKAHGQADIPPVLTRPNIYPERVFPLRADPDWLPLPSVGTAPKLDGRLNDPAWQSASRATVRVAAPAGFDVSPLVVQTVRAMVVGPDLYCWISANRILSSHVAIISSRGAGGVVQIEKDGLSFARYKMENGKLVLADSTVLEGTENAAATEFQFKIPLTLLPGTTENGIQVNLGRRGHETPHEGHPAWFVPAPIAIAQEGPCLDGRFRVRLTATGEKPLRVKGHLLADKAVPTPPELAPLVDGVVVKPGEPVTLDLAAENGPIGPQLNLELSIDDQNTPFAIHLLRYDPLGRTLKLFAQMIERIGKKGISADVAQAQLAKFQKQHTALMKAAPNTLAERAAFYEARLAKREWFFRDPDLEQIGKLLFVKRYPFEPSHNYSVILDSAWRPGGAICQLDIPKIDGRFVPEASEITELYQTGGTPRNPMADFNLNKIYFSDRLSRGDFWHIYEMNPDGTGLKRLTSGPFHDYWPCPLPDGGITFISTRCRAKFLCWRPQAAVLFRMEADGSDIRPLSFANLTEWAPSVMNDGRIIWTRSEYIDKGADYGHTLWMIRPDGTKPELAFGNTIVLPQGYANGREVPGTNELCATMISHFGDLNGPIALLDLDKGRFNPESITSITPEAPWPGYWASRETFRDPYPVARDYFLTSHSPRDRFGLYVIDRFGNRELLHMDNKLGSICPTPLVKRPLPPSLHTPLDSDLAENDLGQFTVEDVYQGLEGFVDRGQAKYIRVCQELRADLEENADGTFRSDHNPFTEFYASPIDLVSGPFGWTSYVAKATWGTVPVETDGSANFLAPSGKVLYFELLDENFNELQRMRSVVQLQPGEKRSCVGCHESRSLAPTVREKTALKREPSSLTPPPWGAGPFDFAKVVQPVLDNNCVKCHNEEHEKGYNLTGTLDKNHIPASYKTIVQSGWVHYLDWQYQRGTPSKADPLTFGTVKSKLWEVLKDHNGISLSTEEMRAIKCWTDLGCPLWGDYTQRSLRGAK